MSTLNESLKTTTKTEGIICLGIIIVSFFLEFILHIPSFVVNPFFLACASIFSIYRVFYREKELPIKNRLVTAFFGGAFIYLFVESLSKLIAKGIVHT